MGILSELLISCSIYTLKFSFIHRFLKGLKKQQQKKNSSLNQNSVTKIHELKFMQLLVQLSFTKGGPCFKHISVLIFVQ